MVVYIGVGMIGVAILVAVALLGTRAQGPQGVALSLSLIEGSVSGQTAPQHELATKERLFDPAFRLTTRLAEKVAPKGTTARIVRLLDRAGNPAPWTVDRAMGAKGMALVAGFALGFLYGGGLTMVGLLIAVVFGVVLFFLPDVLLYNKGIKRQDAVLRGLAESLDMLSVCVEAGQGFDAALLDVARNVNGPISGEFSRVMSEVQIGKPRGEAFSALGERVKVPDVKNFVTAISQADNLGIPIAGVLREQTAALRVARRLRAESKAQQVTVKILFPLLLCIFPTLMIVIIGPGAIRMLQSFGH